MNIREYWEDLLDAEGMPSELSYRHDNPLTWEDSDQERYSDLNMTLGDLYLRESAGLSEEDARLRDRLLRVTREHLPDRWGAIWRLRMTGKHQADIGEDLNIYQPTVCLILSKIQDFLRELLAFDPMFCGVSDSEIQEWRDLVLQPNWQIYPICIPFVRDYFRTHNVSETCRNFGVHQASGAQRLIEGNRILGMDTRVGQLISLTRKYACARGSILV